MPLVASFTATQSLGYPSRITLTDTSTGSDAAIAARRVYITDSAGEYIVEDGTDTDYEVWAYADSTITLDLLEQDTAVYITVDWVNSGGTELYEEELLTVFLLYARTYFINLVKVQSSRPPLRDHANFYMNEIRLLCSIKEAEDAIYYAGDILSAQAACNRAKVLINQPSYFF
jgi:hypothetical protein